uniref:Rho-GAP domain-containing protein n=1 Tax=Clastoptera arizonana TaxID=38151 RepID=A0A1B6E243_9HEMI
MGVFRDSESAAVVKDETKAAQAMQKSKSSSSVVHHGSRLVAKKIWKARSKSSSRATPSVTSVWTPQGNCMWTNVTGKSVTLSDTSLLNLTEIERKVLQKVALAKLQALNLGVNIRIPSDCVPATSVQKPKRRAYLIKRKALTTSIFDTKGKDDKDKGEGTNTGAVFGIPLGQCVENERTARMGSRNSDASGADEHSELRRKSHHGSRGSFSSLIDYANKQEERGSCESLSPTLSMPGMLDNLSCSSALDLTSEHSVVPYVVSSCLRYLETNGLHTLGIFRVSSSKKRVRQLREDFDSGKEMCLDDELCPHDVATLLKEYFRDLPDALLCKDLYQAFIQTQKIRNRRLQHEAIKHLLQLLPVANRDTLWALLCTLSTIALNSGDHKDLAGEWVSGNKMDSNNLATLFAPNILHSCPKASAVPSKDELSAERTEERSDAINVIRCLIDSYRSFFQVPAEILDEVYVHMMDSHPEVLDQLLLRRELANDDLQDDPENSVVSEDTAPTERLQLPIDSQESLLSTSSDDRGGERRVWSREAFTHEHAGMGGPDVEMKPRKERDRTRERITKKRWKDEPTGRRRLDSGGGSSTPSRRTSTTYQDDGRYYSSAETSGQQTPDDQMAFSDRSMDFGVVTGSLKIPVPASTSFTLNLDDADIPFIEDTERQQMTFDQERL